ncbi:MAG: Multiple RNA-binding domain-containing protein 1 [Bathelium mastoideum]|nr:MAG: Multiple RNA-binding domain-containing protein 1 [Bathelium mastoideum]
MDHSQSSSRVFVRGLPPSLSEDEFRKHFSAIHSVTDARLLPKRRIGFVGYRTPEGAAQAVKHFNKSFIRMSKIGVELAQPAAKVLRVNGIEASQAGNNPDQSATSAAPELEVTNGRKRKRDDLEHQARDAKLEEFVETMQPMRRGNRSTVFVQDPASNGSDLGKTGFSTTSRASNERDDEALEKPSELIKKNDQIRQTRDLPDHHHPLDEDGSANTGEKARESMNNSVGHNEHKSGDEDWLRNRTNRLLDLVDEGADGPEHLGNPNPLDENENRPLHAPKPLDGITDQGDDQPQSIEPEVSQPGDSKLETVMATGRLFVRNIPYDTTTAHITECFQQFGELEEVHVPLGFESGSNKGFAYVQFKSPDNAVQALQSLDGTVFQGRLLHILPATVKRENGLDDYTISKLPVKKQKLVRRKAEAASSSFNWNALYMNADAVMSSVSDRLGIPKSTLLDPTSSDAAVKQAHAETHVIKETKSYFTEQGVNLDAFRTRERGDTAILVKNFPYEMKHGELKRLFEESGQVIRFLMPPTGTVAIVEYANVNHARSAFGTLAYRKVKDSILFLEKAPKDLFASKTPKSSVSALGIPTSKPSTSELLQEQAPSTAIETSTLFVRNLSFATSNERLNEVFKPLDGFSSALVKTKPDPKQPGQILSMGFGFVEFHTKAHAQAALTAMDGYNLDGHDLQVRASHKGLDAAAERRKEDQARKGMSRSTKIVIKNLPFEASKKDVRSLFGTYGQLRSVRVPKKFDKGTRGFAFADFITAREAENALESLRNTHLLGRRLVLEFAAAESEDAEAEIEKMQKKVGSQANKVALQKLTGNTRKKFNVGANEEDND